MHGGAETHVSSLAPCEPPLAYFQLCAKEALVNRRALGGVYGLAPELALFRLAYPLENLPRSGRSDPLSGMRGKNAPHGSARAQEHHTARDFRRTRTIIEPLEIQRFSHLCTAG